MNLGLAQSRKTELLAWLNYLDVNFPGSKGKILQRVGNALGAEETEDDAWYVDIARNLSKAAEFVLPLYYDYESKKDLVDLQIARARQGSAPLDPQATQRYAPPPGAAPTYTAAGLPTNTMLWVGGGIAVAALLMLSK